MSTTKTAGLPPARRSHWPTWLCWLTVMLEGFDLVVLGAVIPTLVQERHLGMGVSGATTIATLSLVGVAIGAAAVGPVADRIGRRSVLLVSILVFSIFTLVVPLAGSVAAFAAFRLLAGLGLGACMPTALTFMSEHLPHQQRSHASTFTLTGYHVGAVVASLLALALVPSWKPLFVIGGLAGFVLLPIMWFKLPESAEFLAAREKPVADRARLFSGRLLRANLGVWVGCFMGLLLVYGLNTWLPQLMRVAGYDMSSSITTLLVLNVGAIIGLLIAGRLADRRGVKPTSLVWFGVAAVLLASLSVRMQNQWLLNAVILVTGIFVFSAQALIFAYVTHTFPAEVRNTALGLASAIGRGGAITGPLVTGALVTVNLAYPYGFYFFAGVALLGLVAMAVVPHERTLRATTEDEVGGMQ